MMSRDELRARWRNSWLGSLDLALYREVYDRKLPIITRRGQAVSFLWSAFYLVEPKESAHHDSPAAMVLQGQIDEIHRGHETLHPDRDLREWNVYMLFINNAGRMAAIESEPCVCDERLFALVEQHKRRLIEMNIYREDDFT